MDEVRGKLWWWTGGVRAMCDRLELNGREMIVARDCMWQVTYILVFYSNIFKPLIIFEIDLMVNKNGRPVNHLIDCPP
jgi:hypothetical protein